MIILKPTRFVCELNDILEETCFCSETFYPQVTNNFTFITHFDSLYIVIHRSAGHLIIRIVRIHKRAESKGYRGHFYKTTDVTDDTWIQVPIYFLLGSLRVIPLSFMAALKDWTCEGDKKKDKHEAGDDCRGKNKRQISSWSRVYSRRQSGTSRESPCTPSWRCQPAGIDVPAPHPQPDTLPRSLWTPAHSSSPTPWLNRKAPGQERC